MGEECLSHRVGRRAWGEMPQRSGARRNSLGTPVQNTAQSEALASSHF